MHRIIVFVFMVRGLKLKLINHEIRIFLFSPIIKKRILLCSVYILSFEKNMKICDKEDLMAFAGS